MIIKSVSIGGNTDFTISKLKVSKDLSGRNATAEIEVFVETFSSFEYDDPNSLYGLATYSAATPKDFDEIIIKDHNNVTVFGGFITAIDRERLDRKGVMLKLKARDYNLLLETTLATINHTSTSDRAILQAEFAANLPEISTLTANIEIIQSSIDSFDARNISLAEMVRRLLSLTAGEVWVDFDKALHYFTPGNNLATFELSDSPHGENLLLWSQDFGIVNDPIKSPTAAVGTNWASPTNVFTSDDARATFNGTTQDDLKSTVFGLAIPSSATITGIEVSVEGFGDDAAAANREISVGLTKDGTALVGARKILELNQSTDTTQTLGSTTDLWGTTFTSTEINTSTFGVLIKDDDVAAAALRIDHIFVKIYYRVWIADDATIVENVIKSPGGAVDAAKIEENTATAEHRVRQQLVTPVTGVNYTAAMFLKVAERIWSVVQIRDDAVVKSAWFNLSTGVIGTVDAGATANIEAVGDGWYHCEVTSNIAGTTTGIRVLTAVADASLSHLGVSGSGIYIWGAQLGRAETIVPVALSPTVAVGTNWTNPTNVFTSNDARTDYNATGQDDLRLTDFLVGVPFGATITGIEVSVEGFGDSATAANRTIRVGLTKDGTTLSGTRKTLVLNQSTDTTQTIGSTTDLWSAQWGAGHVNGEKFGVLLSDNDTTADGLHIDHVQVTIHYNNVIPFYGRTEASTLAKAEHYEMETFTTQFLSPVNDITVRGAKDSSGVEIVFNKTDTASISKFRRFEATITDRNITNSTVADLRAQVVLTERANPDRRGTLVTTADGLEIGEQVKMTNSVHFLSSEAFTIRRIGLEQINPTTTEYKIDIGPVRDDLVRLMQRINRVAVADPVFPTGDPPPLSVGTDQLQNDAVTTLKLNAQAVTNAKIAVDAIQGAVIAASAITETKIAADAITTPKIAAGAVTAAEIAAGSIIAGKIAANVITGVEIQAGSITATDAVFAVAAILTADIADLAVTNAKIGLLAVDTAQIAALAVDDGKIANLTVEKLTGTLISGKQFTLTSTPNVMTINGTVGFEQKNTTTNNLISLKDGKISASDQDATPNTSVLFWERLDFFEDGDARLFIGVNTAAGGFGELAAFNTLAIPGNVVRIIGAPITGGVANSGGVLVLDGTFSERVRIGVLAGTVGVVQTLNSSVIVGVEMKGDNFNLSSVGSAYQVGGTTIINKSREVVARKIISEDSGGADECIIDPDSISVLSIKEGVNDRIRLIKIQANAEGRVLCEGGTSCDIRSGTGGAAGLYVGGTQVVGSQGTDPGASPTTEQLRQVLLAHGLI